MERWEFVEGPDARFRWRRLAADGVGYAESATSFLFLTTCVEDARRNGFRQGPPHESEIKRVRYDGDATA